jgi:hypothetical protein
MTDAPDTPQDPQNESEVAPPVPDMHTVPMSEPAAAPETDEDPPAERAGRARVRRPRPDGAEIPPGVRTMRSLRDRNRVIE